MTNTQISPSDAAHHERLQKYARSVIYNTDPETGRQTPHTNTEVRNRLGAMSRMLDNGFFLTDKDGPELVSAFLNIITHPQEMQDQVAAMGALRTVISHQSDSTLAHQALDTLRAHEDKMLLQPAYRQTMTELSLKASNPSHQDPMNGFSSGLRAATPQAIS